MGDGGIWIYDHGVLKNMVAEYFTNLYIADPGAGGEFTLARIPLLHPGKLLELNAEYTHEEIYASLKDMNPLIAPSPDGFHADFFKKILGDRQGFSNWVCSKILAGVESLSHISKAEVVLIPRVDNPTKLSQF